MASEADGGVTGVERATGLRIETALVPAGAFDMGDAAGRPDEQPVHGVHVDAFRIAVTPVTNRTYARFLDATGQEAPLFWRDARFNAADQPVVGITWFDACAFCDWLSSFDDTRWRLPTEAEREKAARGGIASASFPWGDDAGPEAGRFAQDAPRPVGASGPDGFGLYDIAYNVHEWCADWYDAAYYAVSPSANPPGPPAGTRRAARGGAWRHQVKISRCAARSSLVPTFQYNDFGFRVVAEVREGP